MRVPFNIVGGDTEAQTLVVNAQQTINFYSQIEDRGGKTAETLYPTPGLTTHVSVGSGPCRGNGIVFDKSGLITPSLYFVSGDKLVSISKGGTGTVIGTLNTSEGPVSLAVGASHLMVVDGSKGYTWDGTTFATPTLSATPDYVTWIDNYFITNDSGSGRFYISALDDPTSWSALDFATAESRPDQLLRPIWFRKNLLLIGEETSELYYNSGNINFPFEKFPNTLFEFGTNAPDSVARLGRHIFMLAQTRTGGYQILKLSSDEPETISNRGLEWQISQLTTTKDAFGFAYEQAGHQFYVITFPSANRTWCYDLTTEMWHQRESSDGNMFRVSGHGFFNGNHIVGDRTSSVFYKMRLGVFSEAGVAVRRQRRTEVIHTRRLPLFHDKLEIEIEPGVGLENGVDPQLILRWSDDGAKTWNGGESISMGKIGENKIRLRWTKLGRSRNRIYELRCNDPVKCVIVDAWSDVRVGRD